MKRVKSDRVTIFLVGHWGGRNVGDELILYSQLHLLQKAFHAPEFIVYSYNPEYTRKRYDPLGFRLRTCLGFSVRSIFRSIRDILCSCKDSDLIILGGGGIIQDKYFVYNVFAYLLPAMIGLVLDKPVYTLALGIYDVRAWCNRLLFGLFLKHSRFVTVRDTYSWGQVWHHLGKGGNKPRSVRIVPDSAIYLYELSDLASSVDTGTCTIMVREVFFPAVDSIIELAVCLVQDYGVKDIALIVFEDAAEEREVISAIRSSIVREVSGVDVRCVDFPDVNGLLELIKSSDVVIAGRLHGLIASVVLQKRVLVISYERKVEEFCRSCNMDFINIEDMGRLNARDVARKIFDAQVMKKWLERSVGELWESVQEMESTWRGDNEALSLSSKIKIIVHVLVCGQVLLLMHIVRRHIVRRLVSFARFKRK